jgi:L-threonylcarbamoyladenylate synthase
METIIQKVEPEYFADEELEKACQILQTGGLVAFPTETVYGLGGDALSLEASAKIYAAKGRPSDNPLIVHIADLKDLYDVAENISDKAAALAEAFWPGPLTMIFAKKEKVPLSTTGGLNTVAVRMPAHPVAAALIRCSGVYIAAPSANTSGRPSPTRAEHVIEDMTAQQPMILRPGYITKAMMEEVIGEVCVDPAVLAVEPKQDFVPKAPGMKYRHYAPKGQMMIVEGQTEKVIQKINELVQEKEAGNKKTAVIAAEETKRAYRCKEVYSIGSRKSEGSIAAGLYDILRKMDDIGAEYIYAESFAEDTLGQAIMNRMLKAAGYQRMKV